MAMVNGEEKKNLGKKRLQKSYFDVLGICCSSEIPLIENILKSLDGVKEFSVIVPSRTVIVIHDNLMISQSQIAKALNQARLEANVRVNGETSFKKKWPSPFAVVSGGLLLLSFLKYVYLPLQWLAVGAVAAGIFPIVAKAFASIRRFRIDINILVIIAVIATISMQDYTESAAIVFLFTIAEWLESRASYKASAVMQSLMNLAPQRAVIAETGEEVEVDEVKIETVLAVKAGQTIPIDGVVVDGNADVDEKSLTGEPYPVPKLVDSIVWAGTINLNGYISVKTTALAEDCVVAKMAKLVEDAQNSKTKAQRFIDKCSQYYTPAVVIISACFAAVPLALRVHNLRHWFHLALVVLVSACPCGLVLSTPVATFCALTKAATSGLLIKGGDYLETLSKIKIAAFDKTGTITRGEFIVTDFRSLSQDITVQSLLYWVSSIESRSSHPMAAAVIDYAKSMSIEPRPDTVEAYRNFPGEGIRGKIDSKEVYVGNKRIAYRAGCPTVPETELDNKGGKSVGYIYVGERLVGIFNLSDACRTGVVQAMKELKSLGIKTAMLTGDNRASAMDVQDQIGSGMEVVHADLLPEDKARIIEEFKKEGPTAMIGDGLNDAPALATADIGISMGISGSALATQTGNIVLMSNDIRKIPNAIKMARRAHWKVIQNVILSVTLKGGILALAFCGYPLIWAAVLADVGTCLLVILNSMLLLQETNHSGKNCCKASSMPKFKGCNNHHDIETGMFGMSRHCSSGDCGKNSIDGKLVRPSDRVEGLRSESGSEHSHSGCCASKKSNDKVVRPSGGVEGLRSESGSEHSHSGCCASKNSNDKVVRPSGRVEGLRSKIGSEHSGCCGKNNNDKAVRPSGGVEGLQSGSNSSQHSHSGCCDRKAKDSVKHMKHGCNAQSSCNKSVHSGCCTDESEKGKGKRCGSVEDSTKPEGESCRSLSCEKKEDRVKL